MQNGWIGNVPIFIETTFFIQVMKVSFKPIRYKNMLTLGQPFLWQTSNGTLQNLFVWDCHECQYVKLLVSTIALSVYIDCLLLNACKSLRIFNGYFLGLSIVIINLLCAQSLILCIVCADCNYIMQSITSCLVVVTYVVRLFLLLNPFRNGCKIKML